MARPPHTWGKGSKAFTRYESGRLAEEDEAIVSPEPLAFSGKDIVRATPRPQLTKKKRTKLPRPSKNEPMITAGAAYRIRYGDRETRTLESHAEHQSRLKQAYRACFARGYHDWRCYESDWEWRGKRSREYVCIDCGAGA